MVQIINAWFGFLMFSLGSVCASFAGVVAYRLPKGMSLIYPNSYCPNCKHPIKTIDKIPILSWIILGGKCRHCKSKIGFFSLITELLGGVAFMLIYLIYGQSSKTLPLCIFLMILIFLFLIISVIDFETRDIYNITLIAFAILALSISAYKVALFGYSIYTYIAGSVLGFAFFGSIRIVFKALLKKDALGSGDVYLVGIAGFMLGPIEILLSIIIATSIGALIEVIKAKLYKKSYDNEIAFAPYLLLGIGIMTIIGDKALDYFGEVFINAVIQM